MATQNTIQFFFIAPDGTDITGTEQIHGYQFQDFFDCDIETATADTLRAAYKGVDCDGVGVTWKEG